MTYANSGVPSYPSKPHKSGQARIWIKGRTFYLGVYGSTESKSKYARLIAEHFGSSQPVLSAPKAEISVAELLAAFMAMATLRYQKNGKPTSEVRLFMAAIGPVLDFYGDTPANEFGPIALTACRDELNKRGYCRSKINQHIGRIRRIWRWGVSKELVRNDVWQALTSVEGLRRGEAKEMPKVRRISTDVVLALENHVLPQVWAMIQLQLFTAMRPGEVVQMRTCDISKSDPDVPKEFRDRLWVYRPLSHKTEHHDRERLILLGPQAQEVLAPWLREDRPTEFLFSPAEAVEHARRLRAETAKFSNLRFQRKSRPKRAPRDFYEEHAYATAIERGCELAFGMPKHYRIDKRTKRYQQMSDAERESLRIEAREWRRKHCWNPGQLRHNAATWIREHYDIEVARIILGHAHVSTTEIYAEEDRKKAASAIASIG